MIKFPQEETGAQRKLSRPWHGPYRITDMDDTGVTAVKVYYPQDGTIRVHQSRVSHCPAEFPAGYFWYGDRRRKPGRPPKWVDSLLSDQDARVHGDDEPSDCGGTRDDDLSEGGETESGESQHSEQEPAEQNESEVLPAEGSPTTDDSPLHSAEVPVRTRHTRTRVVTPPDRLMFCDARDEL